MSKDYYPNAKAGALFEARQAYVEPPSAFEAQANKLEERVNDLEQCLKGDPTSKRWQELNVELTNKKETLLMMRRRLAGRTPQMESWEDPLPRQPRR